MFNFILKKITYSLLTIFGVVTLIFFLFNVLGGDPAQMMLDQREDSEQLKVIKHKYGFDLALTTQYVNYLNDLSPISIHSKNSEDYTFLKKSKYDYLSILETNSKILALKFPYLRESFQKEGKKVSTVIAETLPNTFVLATCSIVLAFILGIIFGILSALNKDGFIDRSLSVLTAVGMSVPSFFSSIVIAWIFAFALHEYTGLNMNGSLYEVDDLGNGINLSLKNIILPSLALGVRPLAVITQLMRNSLLEVLSKDYIRTAKSKGLSDFYIIRKHALKNALNPVITATSGWFASMLAGSVFIEYIFGWNGLGKQIVDALNFLDLPVVMGSVLTISIVFILINILVDIAYRLLDPKMK